MESIAEIKSGLHHYIAETDDIQTLSKIKKYVSDLLKKENKIVAYTADGRALNQEGYKVDVDAAINEANNGGTVSIEEMEKGL
ncbi:hypothetical protein [Reichenbachiella versicolor]|uniref:hypothetical protein n=1 Tax=Reichenbachiella versicolor TaxID=1821036 RepID=UPI000D6DE9CB|nr:hypothetical protein [Reichenbachiella versicolor]